jgi:hypothetical protein
MTKSEFLESIPPSIEHKTGGYAKLEIISSSKTNKGVCYRHRDKTASGGVYGASWFEVYQKLTDYLRKEGYSR